MDSLMGPEDNIWADERRPQSREWMGSIRKQEDTNKSKGGFQQKKEHMASVCKQKDAIQADEKGSKIRSG